MKSPKEKIQLARVIANVKCGGQALMAGQMGLLHVGYLPVGLVVIDNGYLWYISIQRNNLT